MMLYTSHITLTMITHLSINMHADLLIAVILYMKLFSDLSYLYLYRCMSTHQPIAMDFHIKLFSDLSHVNDIFHQKLEK